MTALTGGVPADDPTPDRAARAVGAASPASPAGPASSATPAARAQSLRRRWRPFHTGLVLLAAASAFTTLWALNLGQRSEYYAAIALSMSQNLSNFFFGAVDPAGTVSLDKIPGSYWVPALFVKAFGFSTWSVDAPNAIATVVAVVLVALTARRLLNPTAGLLAGAVVAATPIVAAVARTNQPESFFVLALALVAWAATIAVQKKSLGWLVVAGAFVALAFQMYMLEAWAVWPALAAGYLCVAKPWFAKLRDVLIAGAASLALSLTWIFAVWLVPASARPYVGGTYGNNPFEMVFGYNGLGRFAATADSADYRSLTPPFSGSAGVLRLFGYEVAGQVAWMIPAALLAIVVLWLLRFSRPVLVFVGGWLVTFLVMFSAVAGMHQFYTASLALPMGLLVGLAFAKARAADMLWAQLALIGTAAASALLIALYYPAYLPWVAVVQAALAVGVAALLVAGRRGWRAPWAPRRETTASGWRHARSWWVSVLAAGALLLTPAAWSLDAMNHASAINPIAGEVSGIGAGGFGAGGFGAGGGGGAGRGGAGGPGALDNGGQRPGTDGRAGGGPAATGGSGSSGLNGTDGGGANADGTGGGSVAQPGTPDGGATAPGLGSGFAGGGALAGGGGFAGAGATVDQGVLGYVQANRGSASYLLATFGAQSASYYITATDGDSVLPIGGFSGQDPAPTLAAFHQLVASGQLRFVLMSSAPGAGGGAQNAGSSGSTDVADIRSWITASCSVVTDPAVGSASLYECAP
ncbi:ArnT family glycosyltransferase [Herbiconiux daphne]|uniref:ArnT family glycosyltransferase n=1 Tax=Herbiconiux daphne TaxID=2970914 RepID=UPI002877B701|nr:glycosyltransferase family 39 protein [Herbiconiux daphne]